MEAQAERSVPSHPTPSRGPLTGLRVIELADEQAEYCGLTLAGLGADVVKVEPPGGSPMRRIGPFYQDREDRERSVERRCVWRSWARASRRSSSGRQSTNRAPRRAPHNKKESIFKNIILGPEPVEKSAVLKEFAYSGDGKPQREVAPESPATRIRSFNGQSEDGTRSGAYVADPFLAPNPNGMLTPAPVTPYLVTDAGTATPHLLNFIPEGEPEQFRPAGFEAPKPGNRPQGPASVRLGA